VIGIMPRGARAAAAILGPGRIWLDPRGQARSNSASKARAQQVSYDEIRANRRETFYLEANKRYKITRPRFIALLAACAEVTQSSL
jgi:hypothetical protein